MPRYLGQHFLKDGAVLKKILAAAELSADDVVLEIGAGRGILTEALAQHAKKVLALEKDPALCKLLQEKFSGSRLAMPSRTSQVEIICGDAIQFNPTSYFLLPTSYKIVANIPYYITGILLRKIFEEWPAPKLIVLMLQKEVAERICANPPKMSLLSASVQFFAEPKIIAAVPKTAFHPIPRVDSAIIRLLPGSGKWEVGSGKFFEVVRAGFRQPRKLLVSNLAKKYPREMVSWTMTQMELAPKSRPAELSVEQWIELAKNIAAQ